MRTERVGGVPPASRLWRTPTPYILLVIGSLMLLIALVLLVLICARNSRLSRRRQSGEAPSARVLLAPLDREPKQVAVIMAGERTPSFLASVKPLASGADDDAAYGGSVPYV